MTSPLLEKLGWRPGLSGGVVERPADLDVTLPLPELSADAPAGAFILAFVQDKATLAARAERLDQAYQTGGHLWLAYPKKSGPIRTDISRDHGFESLLDRDFLPVAQVAIDGAWSALRFRRRG